MNFSLKTILGAVLLSAFVLVSSNGNAEGQNTKYRDIITEIGGGDLEKGLEHLETQAKNGNGSATFLFANLFLEIGRVEKFKKYLEIAAKQGNPTAIKFLATGYLKGSIVKKDYEKARYWYEKGASLRNINSMVYLGIIHSNGLGVEVDYRTAYFWFSLAGLLKDNVPGQKEPEDFADEIASFLSSEEKLKIEKEIGDWLVDNPKIKRIGIPAIN